MYLGIVHSPNQLPFAWHIVATLQKYPSYYSNSESQLRTCVVGIILCKVNFYSSQLYPLLPVVEPSYLYLSSRSQYLLNPTP